MPLDIRQTVKFGILVGLSAIFVDASIAHALLWENDPYWTYWITKTFLITSVFTFGTAFLGIGFRQGLMLTAVHTLILEIYYQWLAPVGLPQEPEWLDFNHLWLTGVPIHFLAIFGGYAVALWVWRRNEPRTSTERPPRSSLDARRIPIIALVASLGSLTIDGLLTHGLLLRSFPGITFFVQHLLIAFVFLLCWFVYVGIDRAGWLTGSVMLGLLWTTYSFYLGPQGLPLRQPTYLGYSELWLKAFPGSVVATLLGIWLAVRIPRFPFERLPVHVARGADLVLLLPMATPVAAADGLTATASAQGNGVMIVGPNPVDLKNTVPMTGSITVQATDKGNRWSHIQNTDEMNVVRNSRRGVQRIV
jgi:hypothetical protein